MQWHVYMEIFTPLHAQFLIYYFLFLFLFTYINFNVGMIGKRFARGWLTSQNSTHHKEKLLDTNNFLFLLFVFFKQFFFYI